LGDANKIYPGLVENIDGMDALIDYVEKHGPITTLGENELRILNTAGITVKKVA